MRSSQSLAPEQQTRRVVYIGIAFMALFSSFNSLQSIANKIYAEKHYQHLGLLAILLVYLTQGIFSFFASFVIHQYGHRTVMIYSALGFFLFQSTGLLILLEVPHEIGWIVVCLGAIICGVSSSLIWVAQGEYISQIASRDRKIELFGLFSAIYMHSSLFSGILITFLLGVFSEAAFFITLSILGFLTIIIFQILPETQSLGIKQILSETESIKKEEENTFKNQFTSIINLLRDAKYRNLHCTAIMSGFIICFLTMNLYQLILNCLEQHETQNLEQYRKRCNLLIGVAFIISGLGLESMGLFIKRYGKSIGHFKLLVYIINVYNITIISSLVCLYTQSYIFGLVISFVASSTLTGVSSSLMAINSLIFPGKTYAYDVTIMLKCFGVLISFGITFMVSNQRLYVICLIMVLIQFFMSFKYINTLESLGQKQQTEMLLINEEKV